MARLFKRRSKDASTRPRKALILGDARCGKSTLVDRFRTGEYHDNLPSTAPFDQYHVDIPYEYSTVPLSIYDMAGDEDWAHIRRMVYPKTDVIILCFDITDRDSFNSIRDRWAVELQQIQNSKKCPILLVGTKLDDKTSQSDPVSRREGVVLSTEIGGYAYVECSSKSGSGVREIFNAATVVAVQHKSMSSRVRSFFTNVFTGRGLFSRRN